ncbi:uncharacterized protein LOC144629866 isoform X5 [Oculina patagonica]
MKILVVLCFVVLMLDIGAYAKKEAKGKGRGYASAKKEARGKGREHVLADQNQQCVFPFTYDGRTYNGCTYAGDWHLPWCSHDSTYDGDWSVCGCSESEADRLNCPNPSFCIPAAGGHSAECYVPFIPTGGHGKR